MFSHALHSPNLSDADLKAYRRSRGALRHRHSLIEMADHDAHLVRLLQTRIEWKLLQEVVWTVESVINVPSVADTLAAPILPSPPVTPVKRFAPVGHHVPAVKVPSHLRSNYTPLDQFIVLLVQTAKVRPAALLHTVIILERLREKLPRMAMGSQSIFGTVDPSADVCAAAMPCSQHRIFLAAIMVSSKYLNDCTPKNHHWAVWACGVFDKEDIKEMECQLLGLLDWDLNITEKQLVDRFYKFIYPSSDRRSRVRPDALKRIHDYVRQTQPVLPLTPISPTKPATKASSPSSAAPSAPTPAPEPNVSQLEEVVPTVIIGKAFVLQAVPSSRKRVPKLANISAGMTLSSSQSAPLDMCSLTMPLTRSRSSNALLEGANSSAMKDARTFSSSNTGTSMTSVSISTSASAFSSVRTPGDRAWPFEASSEQSLKSHALPRRGSVPITEDSSHSGLMSKLLGVRRTLSPTRRVGHGMKGGDRKVSTATIVPEEVRLQI